MDLVQNFPNVFFFHLTLTLSFVWSRSTRIEVINNCTYTVWAAANPGGGKQLRQGEKWTLSNITGSGRIWGRTKCAFGGHDGRSGSNCESGDCNGLLECRTNGRAPNTVGEYSINQANYNDIFYISVLDGFNIPMEFRLARAHSPTSISCCNGESSKCAADVNGPCPMELRDPGGCNNPCTLFGNDQFCCISGTNQSICQPTTYSQFFTDLCKHAFTYPSDFGQRRICPTGSDYEVVFCPSTIDEIGHIYTGADVAKVTIKSNCPRTIWPAILTGGQESQLSTTGFELAQGQSISVDVPSTWSGRFWARSRCSTDASGKFTCITGDCGSGKVECNGAGGAPPATLVEITIAENGGQDYYDVSNVDGFNLPVSVAPQCGTGECKESSCPVNINSDCPAELQVKDGSEVVGCMSACAVFNQPQYCCTGTNNTPETCPPTEYSRLFEEKCPQAYSYPYDDKNSTFTCSGKPDYVITFCP